MNKLENIILQINLDGSLCWNEAKYENFESLPKQLPEQRCIVLLPGEIIFLDKISMPNTSRQNVLKALPFILEDKIVGMTSQMHIVAHKIGKTNEYLVAAIDKEKFEDYFEKIKSHGFRPDAIIPDFLALPSPDPRWMIRISDKMAWVRNSEYSGFSVTSALLPFTLKLQAQQTDAPKPIICQLFGDETETLSQELGSEFIVQVDKNPSFFDETIFDRKPICNFLQGAYRIKTVQKKSKRSYWSYAGFALGLWAAIVFSSKLLELTVFHYRNAKLDQQISSTVKNLFPDEANISDPKNFIERQLQALVSASQEDNFIFLLSQVGPVLNHMNSVTLKTLSYQNNQLSLILQAQKLSEIEQFSNQVGNNQVSVSQHQIKTGAQFITAELTVSRAS